MTDESAKTGQDEKPTRPAPVSAGQDRCASAKLKYGPLESSTHRDQALTTQRRKKPGRAVRPRPKCCARRGARMPGYFCRRLKRSPKPPAIGSGGAVVRGLIRGRSSTKSHEYVQ